MAKKNQLTCGTCEHLTTCAGLEEFAVTANTKACEEYSFCQTPVATAVHKQMTELLDFEKQVSELQKNIAFIRAKLTSTVALFGEQETTKTKTIEATVDNKIYQLQYTAFAQQPTWPTEEVQKTVGWLKENHPEAVALYLANPDDPALIDYLRYNASGFLVEDIHMGQWEQLKAANAIPAPMIAATECRPAPQYRFVLRQIDGKCPKCGMGLNKKWKHCPNCGQELSSSTEAPSTNPVA